MNVALGKTLLIRAPRGERIEGSEPTIDLGVRKGLPPPPKDKRSLGWYGLASVSVLGTGTARSTSTSRTHAPRPAPARSACAADTASGSRSPPT